MMENDGNPQRSLATQIRTALSGVLFARRPVTVIPEEGTMAVVDGGTVNRADVYVGAIFRSGRWIKINGRELTVSRPSGPAGSSIVTDKPTQRAKAEAPEVYKPALRRARERVLRRGHGPVVDIVPGQPGLSCPFTDVEEDWRMLILDTFATRSNGVADVFIRHLSDLCASAWDAQARMWIPDQDQLTTILHIVAAHKPRNEAEAMLAAQMAATHMITMKLAKHAFDYPYDTRTVAVFAKLARTSAMQAETMMAIKGRRRTSMQQITVSHEKHIHHHQHVHVAGGAEETNANPMERTSEPLSLKNAAQCQARTKGGLSCRSKAMRSKRVCRLHGGAGGAPSGQRNGAYRHGGQTKEALALRAEASKLLSSIARGSA